MTDEEIEPDAYEVERSEAFSDFVGFERFQGYTLTQGMNVEPLYTAETIKDQIQKFRAYHEKDKEHLLDRLEEVFSDEQ